MKPPFDLTEFLSKPATTKARSWSRFSTSKRAVVAETEDEPEHIDLTDKE